MFRDLPHATEAWHTHTQLQPMREQFSAHLVPAGQQCQLSPQSTEPAPRAQQPDPVYDHEFDVHIHPAGHEPFLAPQGTGAGLASDAVSNTGRDRAAGRLVSTDRAVAASGAARYW